MTAETNGMTTIDFIAGVNETIATYANAKSLSSAEEFALGHLAFAFAAIEGAKAASVAPTGQGLAAADVAVTSSNHLFLSI